MSRFPPPKNNKLVCHTLFAGIYNIILKKIQIRITKKNNYEIVQMFWGLEWVIYWLRRCFLYDFSMFIFTAIQLGGIFLPVVGPEESLINRFLKSLLMSVTNKLYRTSKVFSFLLNLCSAGAITKANKKEEILLLIIVSPTTWNYPRTRLFTVTLFITTNMGNNLNIHAPESGWIN